MNSTGSFAQNSKNYTLDPTGRLQRSVAQALVELKAKRAEVNLLNTENKELKNQIKTLNEKADLAIKLANNEKLTREGLENVNKDLKTLNSSYEKSINAYKQELINKDNKIAKLEKSKKGRFYLGVGTGILITTAIIIFANR